MIFVRPRRQATIRTRLTDEQVREQLIAIADASRPEGMQNLLIDGYFVGGWVADRAFQPDYYHKAPKNPQLYQVRGTIGAETDGWRTLRLKLRARAPWIEPWMLALLAGIGAFFILDGSSVSVAGASVGIVVGIYAFANLVYVPNAVTSQVSNSLASELRGEVLQGRHWVFPRG